MYAKLRLVFSITILFVSFWGYGQGRYWMKEGGHGDDPQVSLRRSGIKDAQLFSLRTAEFRAKLNSIPAGGGEERILYFPDARGELIPFRIKSDPVFSEELAARFPGIRSFSGYSLKDKNHKIRFSSSHKGLESMIVQPGGGKTVFMQPRSRGSEDYVVYQREHLAEDSDFICYTQSLFEQSKAGNTYKLVDDQVLRKYRLAVSASGNYTQFHGGTVADALAAINATLTRVNQVFETDLAISLELIATTDQVIYTDPTTDPYGNNLNLEVQNTLSNVIGDANYDVGHLFHRDVNGGNAGFIGSVCKDNQKGSAYSAATNPQGDVFDLDFVSHELGHQFGANHTWSFESEGTLVQAEPGSGSTIMGYAGIVEGNNVQPDGDDYFHYYSVLQITQYLQTVSCGLQEPLLNNPPVITPLSDYTIPRGTAFVLEGIATDTDSADVLTYSWEQVDDGVVTAASFGPDNASGANFRSRPPTASPARYFPALPQVLAGNLTQRNPTVNSAWETVSNVEREMNFSLTVRDNASGGGQLSSDLVNIKVVNNAGPFRVSSQSSAQTYMGGSVQTVSWVVADTDKGPINAQRVDILLSLDGGASFPVLLADATPNDGSHLVQLPGTATTSARIMVRADDNIFFAVNAADFTIAESPVVMSFDELLHELCQPDNLSIPFTYYTSGGFTEEVTFSVQGAPPTLAFSFSPTTATADSTVVNLQVANTASVGPGNYPLTVTATSLSNTFTTEIQLMVYDNSFPAVALTSPADAEMDVSLNRLLEWQTNPLFKSYELQLATDASFNNIVESATVLSGAYRPSMLLQNETYYWRIRPSNDCGQGTFGTAFSFSTIEISCQSKTSVDLPKNISSNGTPTITSTINFVDDLLISDLNVSVAIDHTFLADLVITLTSPAGTTVELTSNSCGEFMNIDAVFDDEGNAFSCSSNPAISGVVRPLGSLASFDGESALGVWTLRVADVAPADGGSLKTFSMEICAEGQFRPDADGDGVFDDGDDLCLGTPPGTEVNTDGCPIFRFDPDQFRVEVSSESCIPNDNGMITITATRILDYTVTLTGPGTNITENFTNTFSIGSLAAGTYTACITAVDGGDVYEEVCFTLEVTQPDPLSVATQLLATGNQAEVLLNGSDFYLVELNGITTQVNGPEITLDLKDGLNQLKVSTLLPCQGSYLEEIYVVPGIAAYPNPFERETSIVLGAQQGPITVAIYSRDGRLLRQTDYPDPPYELQVDFSGWSPGIYFITLQGRSLDSNLKVIKK